MSFTFNGENCESHGLTVQYYPSRAVPARRQEIVTIPGKSGDEVLDEEAFTNCTQEYEVYFKNASGEGAYAAKAEEIVRWLLGPAGYADLTDTYDRVGRIQKARVIGGMSFINHLCRFGSGKLQLDCKPERYEQQRTEITGTVPGNSQAIAQLTFPQNAYGRCYPLITIERQGSNGFRNGEIVEISSYNPVTGGTEWDVRIEITAHTTVKKVTIDTSTGEVWAPNRDEFPEEIEITEELDRDKRNGVAAGNNVVIVTEIGTDTSFVLSYRVVPRYFWI